MLKKITKNLILSLVFFQAQAFSSDRLRLMQIVSEPQNNLIHEVFLHLNALQEIIAVSREGGGDVTTFTIEDTNNDKVLLAESQGYKAVFLSCKEKNCTPSMGGSFDLEFLKNALFKAYGHFNLEIRKVAGEWHAYTDKGLRLHSIKLVKGMVGIRKIEVNPIR